MKLIAEICQNHNGSTSNLYNMVLDAKEGGAHYAKIQALYSHELVFRKQFENPVASSFEMYRPFETELARLKNLDLTTKDETEFVRFCEDIGILPMITVFTKYGVERAFNAGFKNIKIASYDSTNFDLISSVLDFATDLFISTGATTTKEVEYLCQFLKKLKSESNITLLHCKTEYPNKIASVNLNRMIWLNNFDYQVGFSDHTATFDNEGIRYELRNLPSKLAIYLGATVIERHFTSLKYNETKDGKISVLKDDIIELIRFSNLSKGEQSIYFETYSKERNLILGNNDYEPSVEEWWNRSYYKGRVI